MTEQRPVGDRHRGGLGMAGDAGATLQGGMGHGVLLAWVSYIRAATSSPDAAVSAATTQIAVGMSKASASTPATSAPAANPPSRQSR
jgi:hypothetical protein